MRIASAATRLFVVSMVLLALVASNTPKAGAATVEGVVTVGMSVPLSGPAAQFGSALKQGVEACIRHINENGGIHGRTLRLLAMDDGGEPQRTVANTRKMVADEAVLALLAYFGAAPVEAVLPYLQAAGVPLIGVASGAESLRDPPNRYLFNLRASYHDETDAIILQLDSQHLNRIAIMYQNDAIGRAALASTQRTMLNLAITPTVVTAIEAGARDSGKAAADIASSNPQAVLMIASAPVTVDLMRQMQNRGAFPQFFGLSMLNDDPLILSQARGLALSQPIPSPHNAALPVARQYRALTKQNSSAASSYLAFEGFLSAKLAVEALKRAGKNATREKLVSALESDFDLDGYEVRFAPIGLYSRSGSRRVEMSVVSRDGRTVR